MVACGRDSSCILKWKEKTAYVSAAAAVITWDVKTMLEAQDISLFFKYKPVAVKSTSSTSTSVTIYRNAQPQMCWLCNSVLVCDCQDFTMFGETFQINFISFSVSLPQLQFPSCRMWLFDSGTKWSEFKRADGEMLIYVQTSVLLLCLTVLTWWREKVGTIWICCNQSESMLAYWLLMANRALSSLQGWVWSSIFEILCN